MADAAKTPSSTAKALLRRSTQPEAMYQMVPITHLTPEQIHQYAPEIDTSAPGAAFAKVRVPMQPPAPAPAPQMHHAQAAHPHRDVFKEMQDMASLAAQRLNPISVDRTPPIDIARTPPISIERSPKATAKALLEKKKR